MTTTVRTEFHEVACPVCGVAYALPEIVNGWLRDHPRVASTYCPNGHMWHYVGKSDAELEAERRRRTEEQLAAERARADQLEASLRATRGVVTRQRNRAHAGACPFGCHRTFANLARHVASKHPGSKLDGET